MRKHPDLTTLLIRETNSKFPRAAAQMIKTNANEKHPTATDFVLFKSGSNWEVVPVGPKENIYNTAQASRTRLPSGRAVAYCHREPVPASPAVNPFNVSQES